MGSGIQGFRNLGIANYRKQLTLRVLLKILSKIPLGGELSDFLRNYQF